MCRKVVLVRFWRSVQVFMTLIRYMLSGGCGLVEYFVEKPQRRIQSSASLSLKPANFSPYCPWLLPFLSFPFCRNRSRWINGKPGSTCWKNLAITDIFWEGTKVSQTVVANIQIKNAFI